MPTVAELRISTESNVAVVAAKDTAALEKMANAAEVVDKVIKRTTQTADGLQRSNDAVARSTAALEALLRKRANAETVMADAIARGEKTEEDRQRTLSGLDEKIQKATQNLATAEEQWKSYESAQKNAAQSNSGTSQSFENLSAAQLAQISNMRAVSAQFRAGEMTVQEYQSALRGLAASYATMGSSASTAMQNMTGGLQAHIDSVTGVSASGISSLGKQADFEAAAEGADKLRAKYVPLARIEQDYEKSQQELNVLLRSGILNFGEYQSSLERVTKAYEDQKSAIAANVSAQESALQAQREAVSASAQNKINAWAGVSTPEYGQTNTRQADFEAAAAEAEKLRAQLVPLAAAQQEYAVAQEKAASALSANIISQKEYDAYVGKAKTTLDRQTASLTGNGGAAKLTAFELGILADEAHKFFDQIVAGGSAVQAAFYQVPNMVQVSGGLRASLARVATAFSGRGALVAGAVAGAAALSAMGYTAEKEQENLAQLSQHLRATRDDYAEMSTAAEKAARSLHGNADGLSLSDSRSVTQTIAAVPTVDSSQLKRLTADARDLATVMGATVPDAAKTLASALQDPAKAAQDFEQQGLSGFNAGLVLSVQHMQQAGDRFGALASVMRALETSVSGAADRALTPFQKSLHDLKDEAGGVGEVVQQTFEHMGDGIVSMATKGLSELKDLVAEIKALPGQLEPVADSIWDTVSSAASWTGGVLNSGVQAIVPSTLAHLMQQGSTPDPVFQSPSSATVATSDSAGPSAQEIDAKSVAVSTLSAHFADLKKTVDANIGSDGSLSGQTEEQRRKIEGLTASVAALNELHAAGRISETEYSESMRNLNGQLTEANVALAGLRGPFADLIEQQERATQSASALTGYDKAMTEASQQADDAARSLSGGLASASEKALVQASAARTLAAEYSTATTAMQRTTSLQGQIASAWSQGGSAAQHATNYVQAYTDALDHYKEGSAAFTQAVAQRTKALDDQYAANQKISLAQSTSANKDQLQVLGLESASIGTNADARAVLIARMQAEQEELQKGNSLQDQSVQAYLDSKDAVLEASQAYQHQQQVLTDVTGSISSMADTLTNDLTQGFVQGMSSGMSYKTMLQGLETQLAGLAVKLALINPLLNQVDGGTRTTLSDVGSVFSSAGKTSSAASSMGVFGSMASLSVGQQQAYKNAITTNAMPASGWAPTADLSALASVKQASALSNLFSGKAADGSGIFSSFGSALGTLGSYAGIAGAAVGIGTTAYSLFKGLFAKSHYAYDDVSGSNGQLTISGSRTKRASDDVTAGLSTDLNTINNTYADAGITIDDGLYGSVGHYKKGKKTSSTSLSDILGGVSLHSDDATENMALQQIMPTSFDSVSSYTQAIQGIQSLVQTLEQLHVSVSAFDDATHVTVQNITGYSGDVQKVLSGLDGKTISTSALQTEISTVKELVGVTAANAESLVDQVEDLRDKYAQAAEQAKQYGLDYQVILDKGNAIAQQMLDAETTKLAQSDQSVQARLLSAQGDQQGADLLNQSVSAAQEKQQLADEWRSFYGDSFASNADYQQQMLDLDQTLAAERLKIQQTYAAQALQAQQEAEANAASQSLQSVTSVFQNLASYTHDLALSDASPLSVQTQYGVANDNFNADYTAAKGGNYDALSRLQSEADSLLTLSKQWNGSGAGYTSTYTDVLQKLQSVGAVGADPFTATLAKTLLTQNTDATLAVKAAIESMEANLASMLKRVLLTQTVSGKAA